MTQEKRDHHDDPREKTKAVADKLRHKWVVDPLGLNLDRLFVMTLTEKQVDEFFKEVEEHLYKAFLDGYDQGR